VGGGAAERGEADGCTTGTSAWSSVGLAGTVPIPRPAGVAGTRFVSAAGRVGPGAEGGTDSWGTTSEVPSMSLPATRTTITAAAPTDGSTQRRRSSAGRRAARALRTG